MNLLRRFKSCDLKVIGSSVAGGTFSVTITSSTRSLIMSELSPDVAKAIRDLGVFLATETLKTEFAVSILPWLRNAMVQGEVPMFMQAAWAIMFDRFPPPPGNPLTHEYQRVLYMEKKAFLEIVVQVQTNRWYRHIAASTDDWKNHLTFPADRGRRRQEWLGRGGGIPKEHQFIVAFEDEPDSDVDDYYSDFE
ncbi:hypothetical protein EYR40_001957 [Pleurotus pulmonarius]|nr:hypothetical protein EYR40_001957 [Pleurotus pulmonarius]KAF4586117.1 hypothetical protein EYR38_010391 [Pleurotus pulmonarius]KAF4590414.1 hypothetical protein EYR38_009714 [Pleurotus pulmonarius]